jgi:hypothetical protein
MALSWTLRVVQLISGSTDACGKNLQAKTRYFRGLLGAGCIGLPTDFDEDGTQQA